MIRPVVALAACAALLTACGGERAADPGQSESTATGPSAAFGPVGDEASAKAAVEAAGYSDVAVSQNPDGAWVGTGMKDGTQVGVTIDAAGAVTAF